MNVVKSTLLGAIITISAFSNAMGQCATPTNLQTSYANNVTSFSWSPVSGATKYVFEAKQWWATWAPPAVTDTVTTNSHSLTGIMPSLGIVWRVKAICANGVSGYDTANFTIPCPMATAPTTTNITMTSATLNWVPAVGYNTSLSDFSLGYRVLGSTTWISLGRTSNASFNLSGLQANTTYEWCVNQNCPYFNGQPLVATFTTAGCTSAGNNSREWISKFKIGGINRSSGAENGGYVQTNQTANLSAGSRRNNGEIVASTAGSFTKQTFVVYVDFNDNGVYESSEVLYGPSTIRKSRGAKFRFNMPSNARSGTHGMRVIMGRNGTNISGCISGYNGETEDYLVNVTGGSNKGSALSVSEQAEAVTRLLVYPNPVHDQLNIKLADDAAAVTVFDLMGKKVYQQQAPGKQLQINVASWAASQYIVVVTYNNGTNEKTRFIKQ